MMKNAAIRPLRLFALLVLTAVSPAPLSADTVLPPKIIEVLQASVFEVVVPKAEEPGVVYEKPLPVELLPFAVRNEKYDSIGTAFAVSDRLLVSAAHVFNLEERTQRTGLFIRDRSGAVSEVDMVYAYSDIEDYVVFSVKDRSFPVHLETVGDSAMNIPVFSVGNAFGEGVVIRNGVLTSTTPESEYGEWSWLRFSAGASPGNSGGPLVDESGRVLGIVARKSQNENLNYAVPIRLVTGRKADAATLRKRVWYTLPMTKKRSQDTLTASVPLPMPYLPLRNELTSRYGAFTKTLCEKLVNDNRDNFFPAGEGSLETLYSLYQTYFPGVVSEKDDGTWSLFTQKNTSALSFGRGGSLEYASLAQFYFLKMMNPRGVTHASLLSDSKAFGDQLLQGLPVTRNFAGEKIRYVSAGKASVDEPYTDRSGRTWTIRVWNLPATDNQIITASHPIPGGFIVLMNIGSTDVVMNGYAYDIRELANYTYFSLYGDFAQWKEYLSLGDRLPRVIGSIRFSNEAGSMRLETDTVRIALGSEVYRFSDESDLSLLTTWVRTPSGVTWDIGRIGIGESEYAKNFFLLYRHAAPPDELGSSRRNQWQKIVSGDYPYDGTVRVSSDGQTWSEQSFEAGLKRTAGEKNGIRTTGTLVLYQEGVRTEAVHAALREKIRAGITVLLDQSR